jgi:trimeric autotransporter adhesin
MKKILLIALAACGYFVNAQAQVTLTMPTQTSYYNGSQTANTNGSYFAGMYNNGSSELGTYANTNSSGSPYIGDPGVAVFHTFTTSENGTLGTARPLQVGDEFTITCYVGNNSSFFNNSSAGISFNGGTTYSAFSNYNTLQRAKFQINKGGQWFSAAGGGNAAPGADAVFKLKVTSTKTVNVKIGGNSYDYDIVMTNSPGAASNIQSFAIWNQTSGGGNDMFWKNASLTSTGTVEIGGGNGTSTFDGAITNGLAPNSTSTVAINSVTKSGTGTITLAAANTYTGNTAVTGGTLRLSGSGTYGIGSNITVSNGAALDLNGVNATVASVRETGTNNGGTIALGAATLTLSGGWSGTYFQNSISGTGNVVKQGAGIWSLYGTQSYTGSTTVSGGEVSTAVAMASSSYTISGGTLRLNAANILPDASNVALSSGTFSVNYDETINNLTISGGTLLVAAGKILTINGTLTISDLAQVSLGAGASVKYGSSGALVYNLGAFSVTPSTEWPATFGPASVTLNSGTVTLNSNKSIAGNLTLNGGVLDLGTYTIDRATSGGTLTVANGATLKIGGTNGVPANYATHSIGATGTIEFSGAAQTIGALNSGEHYGNLVLSGSGIKTMPGDTMIDNDMTLGSDTVFTIPSGMNLTVANHLVNNGNFTIDNNANLIQVNDVDNTGTIKVEKNSAPMFRLDYALWSSPVAGETLIGFSPETNTSRFYHYNPLTDGYAGIEGGAIPFAEGIGYLIRVANTHVPYVNGSSVPQPWAGTFEGVPNNGDVDVTVTPAGGSVQGYNAVGNPYPSPINIHAFYDANVGSIDPLSALYFWRKKNDATTDSYARVTKLAYTANTSNTWGDAGGTAFSGDPETWVINPGQGFIVQATGSTIHFNNDMRVPVNNNQQFRTAQEGTTTSRLWLNLTGVQGEFSQTAIGYTDAATLDIDYGWDGKAFINDGSSVLFSLAGEETLGIQARPAFDIADVVPMGYRTDLPGTFTIALDHMDGVFAQEQEIYLRDNFLGVTHDLKEGAYEFATEAGTTTGRFDVVYAQPLGVNTSLEGNNSIIVYKQGNTITINSGTVDMAAVSIYDMRGRLLYNGSHIDANETVIDGLQAQQQVLIVEVTTPKGKISRKLVH